MREEATDPIVMEALEWSVRMRDDKATAADHEAFEAWLAADETHAAAWDHVEALWKRFDIAQPEFDRLRRPRTLLNRRNFLAGSAAIVVGAGGLYAIERPDLFANYVTGVAERKTFVLPDGSTVELGSYSALSANFTDDARRVDLYRGEGFFTVAADPRRPFAVHAADGVTQALGTRFDVKYLDDLVTIAVNEHAVNVHSGQFTDERVEEGWQVSYGSDGLGKPSQANFDAVEAWRRDRIVFQDAPLRRVLAELERYRRGRIILMDSSIGDIPVTAIFDAKQADGALRTIADTLQIRVFHAIGSVAIVYPAG
jgi:transmembrane sensor